MTREPPSYSRRPGINTGHPRPWACRQPLTKSIYNAAVTRDKLADGSVTTSKFAPDAFAPNAMRLGGVAPGGCQVGWLKASLVVDTST